MRCSAALFAAVTVLSISGQAQQVAARSAPLIEATQINSGIGNYKGQYLWVRLKKDGSLEWQEPASPFSREANKSHSSRVDAKRAALIESDIKSVDWAKFVGTLGPYYRYVDSGVEIQFRLVTSTGEHSFTVINPWPHWTQLKPMPAEIKRTICELQILRAQVSEEKVYAACEDTLRTLECAEGTGPCVMP